MINKRASNGYSIKSLKTLMNEQDEENSWVVDNLLPTAGVSIIVGKPKTGKTTLVRCLATAVATGDSFLGRPTAQGPVLILALEEKSAEVKKHFNKMGVSGNEPIYLHIARAPENALEELIPYIEDFKPILIIIDPLFRFMRVPDGNDYNRVTTAFEPIVQYARDCNSHILFVHHMGKGMREGSDAILGSTAIFGAVDTAIIMKKGEKYRTIITEQRYGYNFEETVLHFDEERRTVSLGETKTLTEECRVGNVITAFLTSQLEPQTEAQIDSGVTGKTSLIRRALRQKVQDGKIIRLGKGGKNDPYRYSIPVPHVPCTDREHENMNINPSLPSEMLETRLGESCSLVPHIGRELENKKELSHD